MTVQVITRDGEAEYAVLPWADYQALLRAAGRGAPIQEDGKPAGVPDLTELSALREAQGLSLEQLARAVGISPPYLQLIENGERQPDAAIRRALARSLNIVDWGSEL